MGRESGTNQARGPSHGSWKGGVTYNAAGYRMIKVEREDPILGPMGGLSMYVLEHRANMAKKIGRPLRKDETVHHIDGDTGNNAIENLQLRQGRHGKHVVLECADCGSCNVVPRKIAS
jgi:HNH endonuclease